MQGLICGHKTHNRYRGFPGVPESGWIMFFFPLLWLRNAYVAEGIWRTTNSQLTNDSKPFPASCRISNLCHLSWNRPVGKVYCSLTIDFISHLSLLIIKNINEIPLNQFHHQMFDSIQKWQRESIYVCSIMCLTNYLFDYFYQFRICWVTVWRGLTSCIVLTM